MMGCQRLLALAMAAACTAGCSDTARGQSPLTTLRVDSVRTIAGTEIHDPYAWMNAEDTEPVVEWARAQDARTRYLMGIARRATGIDSIVAHHSARRGELDAPHERKGVWYYARTASDGTHRIFRSTGPGADGVPLPVPGSVARGPAGAMIWPDPTGDRLVAVVRRSDGGATRLALVVVDGRTGTPYGPEIEGVTTQSRVHWLADGSGFIYTARSTIGESPSNALRIMRYDLESARSTLVYADPEAPAGLRPWTVLNQESDAVTFTDVGAAAPRIVRVRLSGTAEPRVLLTDATNAYPIGESEGRVFFVSTEEAPMGEVLAVSVDDGSISRVVPEDPDGNLQRGRFYGGRIVLDVYAEGRSELRITDPATSVTRTVPLPYVGWMSRGTVGSPWSSTFSFMIEGVVDPGSTYVIDVEAGGARLFAALEPETRPADTVERFVHFESFDGTQVPLLLFHSAGTRPSTDTPVWLYAYGSGGFADAPWHQLQHRAFLDAGGVYAIVGVRGGGMGGAGWREAGEGLNKQVGISDFVAAAEWLVHEGLADPAGIIANGNSAGGPVVTSAVLQRPELFAALLADFAYLDVIGGLAGGSGTALQSRSFGNPDDPEHLDSMLQWSPYLLAQRPGCYPPTFVGHGDRDRMRVYHSYKFVAALQHAQQCDNPVLLQVAWGYGHTLGRAPEQANQLAFLHRVLGLKF